MDATLVTVTVLSMSMAAALSAIVWRMLRLERQRSNARVAALANAAFRRTTQENPTPGQALRPDKEDLQLAPGNVGDAGMFVERPHDSPWGARFAVMAALALV